MRIITLVLFLVVVGCSSDLVPTATGYYENGVYIPTHVTASVNFCRNRGKVDTMTIGPPNFDIVECKCGNGSTTMIPREISE